MQRQRLHAQALLRMFQSSPGPRAGCNAIIFGRMAIGASFNPHPARGPGATNMDPEDIARQAVSILTRPEGRVQPINGDQPGKRTGFQSSPGPRAGCNHGSSSHHDRAARVSILTRPEGRVQPLDLENLKPSAEVSILTRPEGRVQPVRQVPLVAGIGVSILTRPEGRVQLQRRLHFRHPFRFNPHPARGPGATSTGTIYNLRRAGFNPHPARGPGATLPCISEGE